MVTLALSSIELDTELQPREDIDLGLVAEYAEAIAAGAVFPPVIVFKNGKDEHLLADGWHRYYAHQKAKRAKIEAEVLDGDRMEALRYSLGANATHGRQRSELTIKRAYARAVHHQLVVASDRDGVRELLRVSASYARELTQDAYQAHQEATKSIAVALRAKGWTQQKIAKRLGVPQQTISKWLTHFDASGEMGKDDPERLPAQAELEAIAASIDAAARDELEPLLRKELRETFEQELKERIAQVEVELRKTIGKQRSKAKEEAAPQAPAVPLGETAEEAKEREKRESREVRRRFAEELSGPQVGAWYAVIKALEAAEAIDPEALQELRYTVYERKVLQLADAGLARLGAACAIARRSSVNENHDSS